MATMAFTFPILPGQTGHWRAFAAEVSGPRRAEWDDMHRRTGMTENWYLQAHPRGDAGIIYMEGDDFQAAFQRLAASDHPFDAWYREQIRQVHGIDLARVPPGPLSETLAESVGRPAP